MKPANRLVVSEIFGPTVQGEGPSVGKIAGFLRLGGCNLHCTWCDTPYTWRYSDQYPHVSNQVFDKKKELRQIPDEWIVDEVSKMRVPLLIITGGEPLLQAKRLARLVYTLRKTQSTRYLKFEIETAGTLFPTALIQGGLRFNVSPKLSNSGNTKSIRYKSEVLHAFNGLESTAFKFVVTSPEDLKEIDDIVREIAIPARKIWVMPEGTSSDQLEENLQGMVDEVIARRWNITPRLHVQIWGNQRGV